MNPVKKPSRRLFLLAWLLLMVLLGCREENRPADELPASADARNSEPTQIKEPAAPSTVDQQSPASTLQFRMIGPEAGFDFTRNDDMHGQERIFEVNGGGAAVFDFDSDGWLDVFMTNGCRTPLALHSKETPGKVFRNLRHMKFRDATSASGLMQHGFCTGCAAGDVDEDGFEDLYIAAFGPNQLWINNGDGTFALRSGPEFPAAAEWSSSVAFADLNLDGALDVYVATYVVESDTNPKLCPDSKPGIGDTGCSPPHFDGVCDRLLLSDREGGFLDASGPAGLSELPGKSLGVVICDAGGDFKPEIYVANDGQANYLFSLELKDPDNSRNPLRPVHLADQAVLANAAFDEQGYGQGSMGIAASDLDRNGKIDLFLTHFFGETNTLYQNHSTTEFFVFQDKTRASGLGPPSRMKVAWGVAPIDVDNNGWDDLFVVNGHTNDLTWSTNKNPYRMTPQLFQNQGDAAFIDVSGSGGEYFERKLLGRGMAIGDLDRDGRIDAVVSQQIDPSVILQNTTRSAGNSLVLKLVGRTCCRTPVTARVTLLGVDPVACEQLIGGGSYQSASANEFHFGLADTKKVDLEILWPTGDREIVTDVEHGFWTIRQGDQRVWSTVSLERASE